MHNEGNYKQGQKAAFRREKTLANKSTVKELISKIYSGSSSLIPEKQATQSKSGPKNQTFLQRRHTGG